VVAGSSPVRSANFREKIMRFLLVAVLTVVASCSTIGSEKVDRGLCLKYVTFMQERLECVGGRGVAPEICVVEQVPRVSCVRWEWPEGKPEDES
jgi:hypothetical protein